MNQSTDQEFGYLQLLRILVRRGKWVVGICSLALTAALVFTLTQDSIYQSSMQMIIEANFEEELDITDLSSQPSERQREADYATQLNLMRSGALLQRAVDSLHDTYPGLTSQRVKRALTISPVQEGGTETRIVAIVYKDTDPVRAKRVLEALQTVYQDYALERQEQRLNRGLSSINSQFREARRSLSSSQAELEAFRQRQNIIDPQRQATAVTDALNQNLAEQKALNSQYQEVFAQYETLRAQVSLSPDIAFAASRLSQSPRFQTILNELQQTELAIAERRVTYADADAGVQGLLNQRQNQLALLRQEGARVLGGADAILAVEGSLQSFGQLTELDLGLVQQMAQVESALDGIAARQLSLIEAEAVIRSDLGRFPELIASYSRLQPSVRTQQAVLEQLLTQRELLRAEIAKGGFSWQMVASPQLGFKTGPNPRKNMMLGAVVGLVLGGTVAFICEALDDVIRTPQELQRLTPIPVLGVLENSSVESSFLPFVPYNRLSDTLEGDFWLPLRDALDLIYKSIKLFGTEGARSVGITPITPSENASMVSLGLALSAARMGKRVIIVDVNLRSSTLSEWFDFQESRGLSSLLESSNAEPVLMSATLLGTTIDILPSKHESLDPMQILSSQQFRSLIESLERRYDLVILDSPPVLGTADVLEIAACCSDLVMVAQLNQTNREDFQAALDALQRVDNVIGIVANNMPQSLAQKETKNQYPEVEPQPTLSLG